MNLSKIETSLSFLIIAALVITCIMSIRSCNIRANVSDQIISSYNDTMRQFRNKNNEQVSQIQSLYGSISEIKKLSLTKDSVINKLKSIINKNTIAAIVSKTETQVTGNDSPIVIYKTVNGIKDSCNPVFTDTIMTRWERGWISASKYSIKRNITVINDFSFTQELKRDSSFFGFLKPRIPVVTMINKNPNTSTKELRSFVVKQNPPNRLLYGAIGAITVSVLYILIRK